jgi:hypothetical protein
MAPIPGYKDFEYDGAQLIFCGHKRVSSRDLVFELGIKALDRMDPDGVESEYEHPKSWWEAQVRLYGLNCTNWTIDGMYKVLGKASNAGGIEVSAEITELEIRMAKEYAEKSRKQTKEDSSRNDERTTETQPTHSPGNPSAANDVIPIYQTVSDTSRELQLLQISYKHSKLLESPEGPGKDIFGTWQMDCPEITAEWGNSPIYQNNHMIWKIHPPIASQHHLWCQFSQMVVEGVMCIDWKSCVEHNRWKNRKNKFVFRGKDKGDYDFVCDDEWNKGWIKFTSEHECRGEFETQFGEKPWPFAGKKTSLKMNGKRPHNLEKEYKKLEKDFFKKVMI